MERLHRSKYRSRYAIARADLKDLRELGLRGSDATRVHKRALAELPDANTTIWRARDIFRVNVEATEEHAFQTMREATLGRPRTAF